MIGFRWVKSVTCQVQPKPISYTTVSGRFLRRTLFLSDKCYLTVFRITARSGSYFPSPYRKPIRSIAVAIKGAHYHSVEHRIIFDALPFEVMLWAQPLFRGVYPELHWTNTDTLSSTLVNLIELSGPINASPLGQNSHRRKVEPGWDTRGRHCPLVVRFITVLGHSWASPPKSSWQIHSVRLRNGVCPYLHFQVCKSAQVDTRAKMFRLVFTVVDKSCAHDKPLKNAPTPANNGSISNLGSRKMNP